MVFLAHHILSSVLHLFIRVAEVLEKSLSCCLYLGLSSYQHSAKNNCPYSILHALGVIHWQQPPTHIDNIMNVFFRKQYNIMETTSIITDKEFCYLGILFTDPFSLVFLRTKRDNIDIFLF